MNAINKFNLTKTTFMSHAITTENYKSESSEEHLSYFFPIEKIEMGL